MALRLLTFRGLWKLALYTASSPGHGWVLLFLLGSPARCVPAN